jgi:hypothetical protein
MALRQLAKEAGDVLILNTTILSVATFSNIEVVLKIILLVISIVYTADKWYFQNKTIETVKSNSKKRKGVHSKNASKSQNAYKSKYRGQGR